MDRGRKGRQHQVDDHVDERGQRSTRVQARVGVAPDVADQGRNGARREHVAGVERALPPRPAHRQVAGQHAGRRGGRTDGRWQQQRRQKAEQGTQVDLLLGADLHRKPIGQDDRQHTGRDQRPAPWLWRVHASARGKDCKRDAQGGNAQDHRPKRWAEGPESPSQACPQAAGTSRSVVTTVPPVPPPTDETWKRFTDETTCADEIPEAIWTWTDMWVPPWPLETAVAVAGQCAAMWRSGGGREVVLFAVAVWPPGVTTLMCRPDPPHSQLPNPPAPP